MWEAIRANKRRSVVLILAMAAVLVALGYAMGLAVAPEFGYLGVLAAAMGWLFLWLAAVSSGSGLLLGSVGARPIEHDDHPVLFNVVEEMTIAAGLPKAPKVYIMDTDAPNAFAVGTEQDSAVAVTSGLLMRLSRDELQGVVAHEIGHIRNQDTRFMTLAGVMMGAIILLADAFLRGMRYCGSGSRRGGRGAKGQGAFLLLALLFALLAPLVAQLLYFACSRRREYLADASSARFTRYPEGLASALEKIAGSAQRMAGVNRAVAPMFTVNPLRGAVARGLFSTHPPTETRVHILRSMAGAAFADYEAAYAQAARGALIGGRSLAESAPLAKRAPSVEPEKDDLTKAREAVDILHRLEGMLVLACPCGLKVKVPRGYRARKVACPRCTRELPLPVAGEGADAAGFTYRYQPGRWQSFRCPCQWTINLAPTFSGSEVRCPGCGRQIRITRE